VTAGDVEVSGSPFVCEVYDVDHVYVDMPRRAVVGKLYEFQGSLQFYVLILIASLTLLSCFSHLSTTVLVAHWRSALLERKAAPSVCHKPYHVKTNEHRIVHISPSGSPWDSSFMRPNFISSVSGEHNPNAKPNSQACKRRAHVAFIDHKILRALYYIETVS